MALRTGATVATTIDELMEQTLARSDRTVQWAHPDGPVLWIESAAAVLYHKPGSIASGVTQRYVGTIGPINWEKRTELEDDQDFSLLTNGKRQMFAPKLAPEACPDFKVNKGHEVRVKSNFHDLREKGKITRKPAREKQWITSNVVFEMLTAMFKDAITKGTPSWSVTVGKDFSLALVSATAARAGDLAISHRYNEDYVLKWKGVVIKVSIDSMRRSSFRSKITMRHTKAYKDDSSQNTVVTLESSDAGCYNARTQ
ncbi:hypothetical protein D6D06_04901 [Aureobasidium pullulans]|nr:hypothetical protein D6D06_04901 [Aureobasidium pullulans]